MDCQLRCKHLFLFVKCSKWLDQVLWKLQLDRHSFNSYFRVIPPTRPWLSFDSSIRLTVKNIFPVFDWSSIGKKNLFQSNKRIVIPLAVIVAPLIEFLAENHQVNFYLFALIIYVYKINFIQIFVFLSLFCHSTNIPRANLTDIIHKPFRRTRHLLWSVRHVEIQRKRTDSVQNVTITVSKSPLLRALSLIWRDPA